MLGNIKTALRRNLINAAGWRTDQQIVVFESDDWGAVRTPSQQALKALRAQGVRVDDCHYMRNDTLATEDDLSLLFELLSSHRSAFGTTPIITANCLVANPDFARIRASDFTAYSYENVTTTLQRVRGCEKSFALWLEGNERKLFRPQSHGREHLNINRWLTDLQQGNEITHLAFDWGMFGVSAHVLHTRRLSYLAALDGPNEQPGFASKTAIVRDGLQLFSELLGYPSRSFIAPNYVWGTEVEQTLAAGGVATIQGATVQQLPLANGEERQRKRHYTGEENADEQVYLMRNAHFEPSSNPNKDWVDSCMKEIAAAFRWRKPAIIATHRVNYIGGLNKGNRDDNLKLLHRLLDAMIKQWPQVVFMSSDELGRLVRPAKKQVRE